MVKNQQRIEQIAGLALVGAIVVGCGFVLRPFASAILWAAILCFATWPVHELFIKWFKGRRTLAAAIMTVVLTLMLLIPFLVIGFTFTDSIRMAMEWLNSRKELSLPVPPGWIESIPFAGGAIHQYWSDLASSASPLIKRFDPWIQDVGAWLLRHSLDFAKGLLQLSLSILIAFFLYRDGEGVVTQLRAGFQRITGDYAQHLIEVVKTTVQSVVYGMIGTALAQGVAAAVGFAIVGVPSPMLLGLFTFFLSFVPAGPPVVWIGVSVWLFAEGHSGAGIFMVLYGICVISLIDNFVKPYIICRGSKLPFVVMFVGVLGGLLTFGFIGVFLGPTLLAVGYSLTLDILVHRRTAISKNNMPVA
ncbi:MAG: hypothetical protein A2Y07_04060 [Planctomycetes bacterium GWF2_50_10]|nr:MAG: hypothetical protein A2Y07_04060 [Planctomycetes bacterium GWF2_50_10]